MRGRKFSKKAKYMNKQRAICTKLHHRYFIAKELAVIPFLIYGFPSLQNYCEKTTRKMLPNPPYLLKLGSVCASLSLSVGIGHFVYNNLFDRLYYFYQRIFKGNSPKTLCFREYTKMLYWKLSDILNVVTKYSLFAFASLLTGYTLSVVIDKANKLLNLPPIAVIGLYLISFITQLILNFKVWDYLKPKGTPKDIFIKSIDGNTHCIPFVTTN